MGKTVFDSTAGVAEGSGNHKERLKIRTTSRVAFFVIAALVTFCATLINNGLVLQHQLLEVSGLSYEQRILIEKIGYKKKFLIQSIASSDIADHTIDDVRNDIVSFNKAVILNQQRIQELLPNNNVPSGRLYPFSLMKGVFEQLTRTNTYMVFFNERLEQLKTATIPELRAGYNFWKPVDTLSMEGGLLLESISILSDNIYQASLEYNRILHLLYAVLLMLMLFSLWLIWFWTLRPLSEKLERNYAEITHKNEILTFQANHDVLTGLPNRAVFTQYVDNLAADNQIGSLAIMLVDIDHFKVINDNHGHHTGDLALIEFTKSLQTGALENEVLYRLSGDEFALSIYGVRSYHQLHERAEAIVANLQRSTRQLDNAITLQASIGIAWGPRCGLTLKEMFSAADTALYYVKNHGRNGFAFYEDITTESVSLTLKTEQELHLAVKQREFIVHYQPIVNLRTGAIVGLEALLRWNHPENGLMLPDAWLKAAEQLSLLSAINLQVFDRIEEDIQQWQQRGGKGLPVNVNVTESLLLSGLALKNVQQLHQRTNHFLNIGIEVTESVILDRSLDLAFLRLHKMSEQGIRIALDDFGTGFANVSHLNKIPYDDIKIDRSFVSGLMSDSTMSHIIESIITLAKNLGKAVICEGIEDVGTRDMLLKLGCQYGQGFLYSVPMSFDDVYQLLNTEGGFIHA